MQLKRSLIFTFVLGLFFLSTSSAHPGHPEGLGGATHLETVAAVNGSILLGFVLISLFAWMVHGWSRHESFSNRPQR
jgi:hypothetical protein